MTNHPVPVLIKKSARSEGAKKMWERRKSGKNKDLKMNEKQFDWHLFLGVISIIITLGGLIFGCYFSLKSEMGSISKEITKIQTVLILKGICPAELFTLSENHDNANYD